MRVIAKISSALSILIFFMLISTTTHAQGNDRVIRVARLVIDSMQLEKYKAAATEEINAAISKEPGVLTLYAVYEKEHPTHVTVFEIYANNEAYQAHRETAHFKKYKSTTQDMVKSLELLDMAPIVLVSKGK
jgi:quinol monooxygenase YgiN